MARFPSPVERNVASALLLLSTTTPFPRHTCCTTNNSLTSVLSSSSSLSTAETLSSSEVQDNMSYHKLRFASAMPRCLEMKPKIVRKKRSDVYCISTDLGKPIIALPKAAPSTLEEEEAASSCLSSTSISRARSRSGAPCSISKLKSLRVRQGKQSTATTGSMSMRRQEIAILKMLSGGRCFSEVRIRELLGNSPDTSKALRMLLKREKIRRSGKGGRPDPYVYRIA